LQSKIDGRPDTYLRQQDTLIVWNEPIGDGEDDTLDLALSFQEASGCLEVWNQIQEIQRIINPDEEAFRPSVELPPANLNNIDQIVALLYNPPPLQRDSLATTLLTHNYLPKLTALFKLVIDNNKPSDLAKIYRIASCLFLLNCKVLIEELLNDFYIHDIFSALEFDPLQPQKPNHSQFLTTQTTFKEVVPFNSPILLTKVHQTFRLTYLKDVGTPRLLDEPTLQTVAGMIHLNNHQIISHLANDDKWIHALMTKVQLETDDQALSTQISFIEELCQMTKFLDEKNKALFFQCSIQHGLFEFLQKTLTNVITSTRLSSASILLEIVSVNPSLGRSYIIQQPQNQLLKLLIDRVVTDPDTGINNLLVDILRLLLDEPPLPIPEPIPRKLNQKISDEQQTLLNIFYPDLPMTLFSPLLRELPKLPHTEPMLLVKCNLCDLLGSFVEHHFQRIKTFLLNNEIITKIFILLQAKEKFLAAAAVRLFRKVVGMNDPDYDQHIIRHNLLEPIIEVFLSNGDRYNILNSVILELFEYIADPKQNHATLIRYYVENFHTKLKDIEYPNPFTDLNLRYQRISEYGLHDDAEVETPFDLIRETNRLKYLEQKSEEAWFSEDDDEMDNGPRKRVRPDETHNDESPRKKLKS